MTQIGKGDKELKSKFLWLQDCPPSCYSGFNYFWSNFPDVTSFHLPSTPCSRNSGIINFFPTKSNLGFKRLHQVCGQTCRLQMPTSATWRGCLTFGKFQLNSNPCPISLMRGLSLMVRQGFGIYARLASNSQSSSLCLPVLVERF